MPIARLSPALLLALATAVACTGPRTAPTPSPTTSATASVPPTAGETPGASPTPVTSTSSTPAGATFVQPWAVAPLTDVTTDEQFRLADLAADGQVVFVETMAIWCTSCESQQRAAAHAFSQLDPSRVEWVALDVDPSERADGLALYRELNGFPFRYAVSDTAMSRALADAFGDLVLNPPSINVIVLGADGQVTHLNGFHSATEVIAIAEEHGA